MRGEQGKYITGLFKDKYIEEIRRIDLRTVLWNKQQICSEDGNLYDAEYYLLIEEIRTGDHIFCENYGVKICISGGVQSESLAIPRITPSAERATSLLDALSRNFVTPVSLPDILEDWLA